MFTMTLVDVE